MATTIDFNPRPPHEERLGVRALRHYLFTISTHVPRRGGERRRILGHARGDVTISIHAPRGGATVSACS